MPDWFYRTVSRPLLFRLPAARARDLALGLMARLARLPLGPQVIDFMGHMRADARLSRTVLGVPFPSPAGLGPALDGRAVALPALARFGVGFLEVGPVTAEPVAGALERREAEEAFWLSDPPPSLGVADLMPRLAEASGLGLPLFVRLGHRPGATPESSAEECRAIVGLLAPQATAFTLATLALAVAEGWSAEAWQSHLSTVLGAAARVVPPRPVLVVVPADLAPDKAEPYLSAALAQGAAGALVEASVAAPPGRLLGLPARELALSRTRELRQQFGPGLTLVAGGAHEPEHALALLEAGADLVSVDTGLVYTGPGLPKRCNEAILWAGQPKATAPPPEGRAAERTWLWTTLMGAGMFVGSLLALYIAATDVVLHYDAVFSGMKREDIEKVPRLKKFMAHDRVSLAGTMLAIGVLYLGLSLFGVRRGLHWARQSVFISAFAGFGSFFLFLGFGYFDPFHAFVTAILFQFLLLGVHSKLGPPPLPAAPDLDSDEPWLRAQWGQFLLVLHAVGLVGAGVVICCVGVTTVFVPEDLEFMDTTARNLQAINPRLVPLVAHDRATFGGMLVSGGLALLTSALWGPRPGSAWLWWTMLLAVVPGYAAAIIVHYAVGYTNWFHLLPAYSGLATFLLGLALCHRHLTRRG